jgi:hypothetical protein
MIKTQKVDDLKKLKGKFNIVFSGPEGMEVLRHILKMGGYGEDLFCENVNRNNYMQGRNSLAVEILKMSTKEKE